MDRKETYLLAMNADRVQRDIQVCVCGRGWITEDNGKPFAAFVPGELPPLPDLSLNYFTCVCGVKHPLYNRRKLVMATRGAA